MIASESNHKDYIIDQLELFGAVFVRKMFRAYVLIR